MKYKPDTIALSEFVKNLTKPRFQRNFIWSKSFKLSLIQSIMINDPIGVITVSKKEDSLLVIDGLQRSLTIIDFLERPSTLFKFDVFWPEFKAYIRHTNTKLNEQFNKYLYIDSSLYTIKSIYEEYHDNKQYTIYDYTHFTKEIEKGIQGEDFISEDITHCVMEYVKYIQIKFDISSYKIVILECIGKDEEFPKLFEKMNSTTKKLTKYEVYAAMWDEITFKGSTEQNAEFSKLDVYEKQREIRSDYGIDKPDNDTEEEVQGDTEKDICLYQIFRIQLSEYDKFNKVFEFEFNESTVMELISLSYGYGLYGINKLVKDNITTIYQTEKNVLLGKIINLVKNITYLVDVMKKESSSIKYKFQFYYKMILMIYKLDIHAELQSDNFKDIVRDKLEKYKEDSCKQITGHAYWKDHRQTSDINNSVVRIMSKNEDTPAKSKVIIKMASETKIVSDDNKFRIQVQPVTIREFLNQYENVLVGSYLRYKKKDIIVIFDVYSICESKATNLSLYVFSVDLDNFISRSSDKKFKGNVTDIFTIEEFNEKYEKFNSNANLSMYKNFQDIKDIVNKKEAQSNLLKVLELRTSGKSYAYIDNDVFKKVNSKGWIAKSIMEVANITLGIDVTSQTTHVYNSEESEIILKELLELIEKREKKHNIFLKYV